LQGYKLHGRSTHQSLEKAVHNVRDIYEKLRCYDEIPSTIMIMLFIKQGRKG